MKKISKTIILKVSLPDGVEEQLRTRARLQSKWMNKVIRLLYADKRNWNWKNYGPSVDWGGSYEYIVTETKTGIYKVKGRALYPAFIGKTSPIELNNYGLEAVDRQATLGDLGTIWQNFLNGSPTPRPHTKQSKNTPEFSKKEQVLPTFKPVARFRNQGVKFEISGNDLALIIDGQKINVVTSTSDGFKEYSTPFFNFIKSGRTPGVEFHEKNGKWYVHIVYELDKPSKSLTSEKVLGIDLGINYAAASSVYGPTSIWNNKRLYSYNHIRSKLNRNKNRMDKLRSLVDKGSHSAKIAKDRLVGKHRRTQETFVKQTVMSIINDAKTNHAEAIAMEDLSRLMPKRKHKSLRFNRRLSTWPRGMMAEKMELKCVEHGIKFRTSESYTRYSSQTCPVCGNRDKKARNWVTHLYTCMKCGHVENDDINASMNIAKRGWNYYHACCKKCDNRENNTTDYDKGTHTCSKCGHIWNFKKSLSKPQAVGKGNDCTRKSVEDGCPPHELVNVGTVVPMERPTESAMKQTNGSDTKPEMVFDLIPNGGAPDQTKHVVETITTPEYISTIKFEQLGDDTVTQTLSKPIVEQEEKKDVAISNENK